MLSGKGSVLVRVGQKLSAVDVVAEEHPRGSHLLLDVPSALGISRGKFSKNIIVRKVGDRLVEGDIIAEYRKMFNRVLRAPAASEILMISNGVILLEMEEDAVQLKAGFSSTVVEVIPDRGVILEASGALIQGIWGNNRINMGLLTPLADSPSGELAVNRLDISLRGAVGLAGHCRDKAALLAAAELPLQGLILGSMTADLVGTALQLEIPVILLEGFGRIPINQTAYKILSTNAKRDVCLNAAALDRYLGDRPEVLIPLPATADFPPETDVFKYGQTVRVLSRPHLSATGTLEEVIYEPVLLANGLRSRVASVRLENNERVSIPFANLEVLE